MSFERHLNDWPHRHRSKSRTFDSLVPPGTAPSTDELALEFSEAFALERGNLQGPARDAAQLLDGYLTEISVWGNRVGARPPTRFRRSAAAQLTTP
jgi:hypothetical protein